MRYLYGLIFATSLCVIPSVSHAAAPSSTSAQARAAATVATPASKQAQPGATANAGAKGQADDKARYAEREAESSEAQDYRGGDTVVIGATTATAILAVLLLIVLI
jgi:hypothetical protein